MHGANMKITHYTLQKSSNHLQSIIFPVNHVCYIPYKRHVTTDRQADM